MVQLVNVVAVVVESTRLTIDSGVATNAVVKVTRTKSRVEVEVKV